MGKRKVRSSSSHAARSGDARPKASRATKKSRNQQRQKAASSDDAQLHALSIDDLEKEMKRLEMIQKIKQTKAQLKDMGGEDDGSDDDEEEEEEEEEEKESTTNEQEESEPDEEDGEEDDVKEDKKMAAKKKDDEVDETESKFDSSNPWYGRYLGLKKLHDIVGHCNVEPASLLGVWSRLQRKQYKKLTKGQTSALTRDHIKLLIAIDFDWEAADETADDPWEVKYEHLMEFSDEHGHSNVPQRYSKNPSLGRWVKNQRFAANCFKKGKGETHGMNQDRIDRLNELGLTWEMRKQTARLPWEDRYEQLKEYHNKNGDCNVPQQFSQNRPLGNWVSNQRQNYKLFVEGKPSQGMDQDRIELLHEINFCWNTKAAK